MNYTTSAAAARLGVARQTIRAYAARYARFLSTEGAPAERSQARRFTDADLKTLAYVRHQTELGATHDDIAERLSGGVLDAWEWAEEGVSASRDDQGSAYDDVSGHSALIPAERLLAAQALLQDVQMRMAAEEAKNAALQDEIRALERALGSREGELAALRASKPKGFWARLLGGE
jgi:DNA-binding transcriptional MerR regulator